MRGLTFLTTMLLGICQNGFCQLTFEKAYTFNQTEEIAISVTADAANGFVSVLGNKRDAPNLNCNFKLVHLNSIGDTVWSKTFIESYYPQVKAIKKSTDAYIVLGIAEDSAQIHDFMYWLAKFDTSGNLLWKNFYSNSILNGTEDKTSLAINSIGNYFVSTGYDRFFTVDTAGILLNIGTGGGYYFSSIDYYQKEKLENINGYYYFNYGYSSTPPANFHPKILKVFENADTVSSIPAQMDSALGFARFLKSTSNSFIILGTRPFVANDYGYFITKIDSAGNNIFNKRVKGKKETNCYIPSNAVLKNGNMVFAGFPGGLNLPTGKAFLYCYNDNGDSLWYKEFSPSDTSLKTEFYDVIATADSGLLACGQMLRSNGTRASYFVKLDANGNLFNPLSILEKKQESYLHLYPNPAKDYTSMHYIGVEKNARLSIYNLHGQLVESRNLNSNNEYITLNTSQFAPGFYFCKIEGEHATLLTKKLTIIRE